MSLRFSTASSRLRVPSAIAATDESTAKRSRSRSTCARLRQRLGEHAGGGHEADPVDVDDLVEVGARSR
jgi:hypothetical protein